MRVFFETKSWRLFSFLFGLGFSIQMLRAAERGRGFLGIYLRRIVILFVIGMGHALFYDGDILMIYAILGLGLLAFRRASPRIILVVSLSLLCVFPVERAVRALSSPSSSTVAEGPDPAAARARLEEGRRSHPYAIPQLIGDVAFAFGSTALALGYAAGITLLAQSGARRLVAPLAPVGRLALSVYLGQTLLFTTLFYGYAFDQAFRLGPAAVTAYALLFFALQLGICALWARHFRFGPMEWLWRALTYGKLPPFRVAA